MPGSRLYPEITPPLPRSGPPLHEPHLDERPRGLADGTPTRSQCLGQIFGRPLRRVGDHEHPQHPSQHPREPELPEQEPELLDVPTPLLVQRTSVEALRGPQHTPVFRKFQYLLKLLNTRSVGLVSEYSFGLPRLLVGSEVLFDARSEGFLYLVLAHSRAGGEEVPFRAIRNKDGLGYDRGHVALEEDPGGELVWCPSSDGTLAVGRRQGPQAIGGRLHTTTEEGVGQFLVFARLAIQRGGVVDRLLCRAVHVDGDEDIRTRVVGDVGALSVGKMPVVCAGQYCADVVLS